MTWARPLHQPDEETMEITMPTHPAPFIRVRDVVRGDLYELGPREIALRVSYDMFHPTGPVRVNGELAEWTENAALRTSRVIPTMLEDVDAGERVLLRVGDSVDGWWLCDVEIGE
ncbi:MAG: hypothetical protein ACRELB_02765 [Polyangiaceae bacterium]